jgi:hypothetical protein
MFNSNFPNMNNYTASNNLTDFNLNGQGMLNNPTLNYLYLIQYQQAIIQNFQNIEQLKQNQTFTTSGVVTTTNQTSAKFLETQEKVNFT